MENNRKTTDEYIQRVHDIIDEVANMVPSDMYRAGHLACLLKKLGKSAQDKADELKISAKIDNMLVISGRRKALDPYMHLIYEAAMSGCPLDDQSAGKVAELFFIEYVLNEFGNVRSRFSKYGERDGELFRNIRIAFAVDLTREKTMASIKKYLDRHPDAHMDNSVRQVLASIFHDVLRIYEPRRSL